jgi:hypothetical protein
VSGVRGEFRVSAEVNRKTIEIDQAGPPDIRRLSRQVSAACDRWLRKRGLAIERGAWGPARKKENAPAEKGT